MSMVMVTACGLGFRPGQAVELYFGPDKPATVLRVISITPTTVQVGFEPVVVDITPPRISNAR